MCFVCVQHSARSGEHPNHIGQANRPEDVHGHGYGLNDLPASGWTPYINTLYHGLSWGGKLGEQVTVSYSFDSSGASEAIVYAPPSAFNETQQQATRQVLAEISGFAGLTFVEAATSSAANIHFYSANFTENFSGLAGYFYMGKRLINATVGMDVSTGDFTQKGSYGYYVLLHEIGHALGLKHAGNYRAGEQGAALPEALDSASHTVMSYNTNPADYPTAYGALDVAALQHMYGQVQNISVASNVPAALNLQGNAAAERFTGGTLNDTIHGSGGHDTIIGGLGNDSLLGGDGNDLMQSGQGADTIYGDAGDDQIFAGRGRDSVYGGDGDDLIYGANPATPLDAEDVLMGGAGNDSIYGNGGNDTIDGEAGDDWLHGGAGGDIIRGGEGADTLSGGTGNDTLTGGAGADIFIFDSAQGQNQLIDFTIGEDILRLSANLDGSGIASAEDVLALLQVSGNDALLAFANTSITLFGVGGQLSFSDIEVTS